MNSTFSSATLEKRKITWDGFFEKYKKSHLKSMTVHSIAISDWTGLEECVENYGNASMYDSVENEFNRLNEAIDILCKSCPLNDEWDDVFQRTEPTVSFGDSVSGVVNNSEEAVGSLSDDDLPGVQSSNEVSTRSNNSNTYQRVIQNKGKADQHKSYLSWSVLQRVKKKRRSIPCNFYVSEIVDDFASLHDASDMMSESNKNNYDVFLRNSPRSFNSTKSEELNNFWCIKKENKVRVQHLRRRRSVLSRRCDTRSVSGWI